MTKLNQCTDIKEICKVSDEDKKRGKQIPFKDFVEF